MNKRIIFLLFLASLYGISIASAQQTTPGSWSKSVYDFGAKGDSTTDDSEAIQKAVNSGVGHLNFPSGTYRITRPIVVNLDKVGPTAMNGHGTARIIMAGAGPAFKFVGTHQGTAAPSTVKGKVWESERMPVIEGMEIIGRHPKAVGIEASRTMQLTVTRVLVRQALHGIHLTNRNRNVIISNSHFYHNAGIGIYLDNVNLHQINITNSHISYNSGGGIVVRGGEVRNIQIGSCDIEANMDTGGPPTANILMDMTDGTMREGAITGSTIQHTGDAPESANIRFIGHGRNVRQKTGNFTIADNAMSDARYNLDIQYGRGLIITGNTFWKGFTHNIRIQQSDHINIGPNLFDRNPDYGTDGSNSIMIQQSGGLTLNGLHLNNTNGVLAGIVLEQCWNYNLTNSTILNAGQVGILLKDSKNGKVSGNFISDDGPPGKEPAAIRIQGGRDNIVTTNYTDGSIEGDSAVARIFNNYSAGHTSK